MEEKIKIGVVGCGYWGPNLVRNFQSFRRCIVSALCDSNEQRLTHMRETYPGVETTTEFEKLVSDENIDAIAIATPGNLHYEMAKKSLLSGKHTYIEKPMTTSEEKCRELIALAEKLGLTLMVGHTFIYSAPVRVLKEIVDSGEIGELNYISSSRLNLGLIQKDINVAWDLAPHDLSIILYVTGALPLSLNCQGSAHVYPGIEDVANMSLEFPNGVFAAIQSSWLDPKKVRTMTFVGSKKMVLYNDTEPLEKIKIYDRRVEAPPYYDSFGEFHFSYHYGDVRSPHLNQVEPLKALCQEFIDSIENHSQPESSGLEGLQVVKILESASLSLKNKGANVTLHWD